MSIPLLFVPVAYAWPASLFMFIALGSLGVRLGQDKHEDIFAIGWDEAPRERARRRGDLHVLDTSALVDGRVADLVSTGFISGTLLVHEGVLHELQAIADSSDPQRRTRGRRGLDVLVELQKSPHVQIQLYEEAGVADVDAALVRLARESGASLDHGRSQPGARCRGAAGARRAGQRPRVAVPDAGERRRRDAGAAGARRPRPRPGGRLSRRRHDGGRRGRDLLDRVAGGRARAQRDPDDHRPDDLRHPRGGLAEEAPAAAS